MMKLSIDRESKEQHKLAPNSLSGAMLIFVKWINKKPHSISFR
ncbi:hypothetical protein HMPREF1567_3609 [Providencia alcalifaciens PAL-2]|uniref:Uncharacterized protein n=1 Tax=Providencia alcalifaciens 205/92 TaxID=1256988 RepID=A0AAV3M869_9GAMM|nr:hypothetical protein HMPREF1562_2511 [Providencia alcalifaciens F90-2004]EUC96157.1 hypothetical protein HMPREF1567_3609 [Providencia alcalifaciens PAL-2]EUD11854.1 hypothetical protein HMPREF1563_0134 [Providencia alcalifaciens 205/92]